MRDVFICDAIRTPIGRFGGGLSTVRADDLAALPIKALMERNPSVDWSSVDEVFLGCANQAGEDNRNVARMSSLLAGLVGATVEHVGHGGPVHVGVAIHQGLDGHGAEVVGAHAGQGAAVAAEGGAHGVADEGLGSVHDSL